MAYDSINIIIPSIATIVAVFVTWKLTSSREKWKFRQDILLKRYNDMQDFYVDLLAVIDKSIRIVKGGKSYDEIVDEISRHSAKVNLIGSEAVKQKLQVVSDKLQIWSIVYIKGMPKRIGDTTLALFSSSDRVYIDKAESLFPEVRTAIYELSLEVKIHLSELGKEIEGRKT